MRPRHQNLTVQEIGLFLSLPSSRLDMMISLILGWGPLCPRPTLVAYPGPAFRLL